MSALRKTAPDAPSASAPDLPQKHLRAIAPPATLAIALEILTCRALDGNEKLVYATLRHHDHDPATNQPWRQEDLADFLGIARSTLTRVLRRLCSIGLLKMTRVGLRLPNRYYPQPLEAATIDLHETSETRQEALAQGRRQLAQNRAALPPDDSSLPLLTAHSEPSENNPDPGLTVHRESSKSLIMNDQPEPGRQALTAHDEGSSTDDPLPMPHDETSHTPATAAAAKGGRERHLHLLSADLGVNFTAQQIRAIVAAHGDDTFDRIIADWCQHREGVRKAKGPVSAAKIAARFIRDGEGVPADLSQRSLRPATWTAPTNTEPLGEPEGTLESLPDVAQIPPTILARARSLGLVQGTAPFTGFIRAALSNE